MLQNRLEYEYDLRSHANITTEWERKGGKESEREAERERHRDRNQTMNNQGEGEK